MFPGFLITQWNDALTFWPFQSSGCLCPHSSELKWGKCQLLSPPLGRFLTWFLHLSSVSLLCKASQPELLPTQIYSSLTLYTQPWGTRLASYECHTLLGLGGNRQFLKQWTSRWPPISRFLWQGFGAGSSVCSFPCQLRNGKTKKTWVLFLQAEVLFVKCVWINSNQSSEMSLHTYENIKTKQNKPEITKRWQGKGTCLKRMNVVWPLANNWEVSFFFFFRLFILYLLCMWRKRG